jgi:hypothetical protein
MSRESHMCLAPAYYGHMDRPGWIYSLTIAVLACRKGSGPPDHNCGQSQQHCWWHTPPHSAGRAFGGKLMQ